MPASSPYDNTALQARIDELERRIQVEEALERVRARTMAMQNTNELGEVVHLLYQQLEVLGRPQRRPISKSIL